MNTTTHTVTEVKSEPYFNFVWCVDVVADSWGNKQPTTVHVSNETEALRVCVGYTYEA